ncbi:hypothetical protein P3TCK_01115 [Photobacterium profundum 3TCK]|jgi:hypothetical protein|uniref:Uncharacterized protein n=1 Tax=Photobacterium profundum 3TCK TaxID=314280 RepID=Q1YZV4_9GAMM|nr:hypothetical protein P3TCK_01115 [Photobacterium profundum 3TCK]
MKADDKHLWLIPTGISILMAVLGAFILQPFL